MLRHLQTAVLGAVMAFAVPIGTQAAEQPQEWELVNPRGVIENAAVKPAPRITSLEGKTVALRWNGKHNGDVALNHLGELLVKKYPSIKVIKTYETDSSLVGISGSAAESQRVAKAVAAVKPDLVIASQCD